MGLAVRPATLEDLERIGEIYADAFVTSAVNRSIFGQVTREDAKLSNIARFTHALTCTTSKKVLVAISQVGGAESIVGFANYSLPLTDEELAALPADPPRQNAPGTDEEKAKSFFGELHELAEVVQKERGPHYALQLLATDPKLRTEAKGAGRALVQWGIDKAAEENVFLYLESTPEANGFYEKLGLKAHGPPVVGPNEEFLVYPMLLDPKEPAA